MAQPNQPGPMAEMNTTPLIDVMLVLLIMFIITIPVATHAVQVDLPRDCPGCPAPDRISNKVAIDAGDRVLWNGTPVAQHQLAALLQQTRDLPVEPELQFEPDANASYAISAQTLNTIEQSGVTKFGFVGNERYRSFARTE
ncbi:biopolymer transporter ExbD [Leptolyngbya sp. 15MV]|nr:biopolymer transporter ExbD [Leptolyngbya sp. 15MV]